MQDLGSASVNIYATEEEQVESIKKWWKENGRSVIAGVVIGLGGVFGWRWWVEHQNSVAQAASSAFERVLVAGESDNKNALADQIKTLQAEYGNTAYAAFANLVSAQARYRSGDKDGARAELEKVVNSAPDPAIREIAVLRLARILLDQGDPAAATAVLGRQQASKAFAGDFSALRGDIALAEGDTMEAKKAYTQALEQNPSNAAMIQLKLDNLPTAG